MLSSYRFWSRKCQSVTELKTRTRPRRTAASPRPDTYVRVSAGGVGGGRPRERPADCPVNKGPKAQLQTETKMIFYSHDLTITIAASGRHLRTEYGLSSRCAFKLHIARPRRRRRWTAVPRVSRTCTMYHASSFSSTTRKPVHDVGCSASERSCESMGERQGKTSSVEPKCVVPALGLGLGLGGARRLRSQIRLRPHNTGPRRREGEGGREDSRRVSTLLLGVWVRRERKKEK